MNINTEGLDLAQNHKVCVAKPSFPSNTNKPIIILGLAVIINYDY